MPTRARRSVVPDDDPRIRRQELAHGIYKFKDVWAHYKRLGWTTRHGGELGYDHYYIKPGKSVKHDVDGVDFFYGEAAIVAYGMKEKIFGDVPEPQPSPMLPRRVQSATRGSASGSTCNSDDDDDVSASASSSMTRRLTTTRRTRLKQLQHSTPRRSPSREKKETRRKHKQKEKEKRRRQPGGNALDAISITSSSDEKSTSTMSLESSDDDASDTDFRVDTVDDGENDNEEEKYYLDSGSDDSEEDPNEDDIVVVNAGVLASRLKGNFQAKKQTPRPLLSTKKRKAGDGRSAKQEAKRSRAQSSSSSATMKSEPKFSARAAPFQSAFASKPSAPSSAASAKSKRKLAEPRRLSVETETATEPRQQPSSSQPPVPPPTPATGTPTPRHSFLSPTTPPQSTATSKHEREVTPSTQGESQVYIESSGEPALSFEPDDDDHVGFEPDHEDYGAGFEQAAPVGMSAAASAQSAAPSCTPDTKPIHPAIPEAAPQEDARAQQSTATAAAAAAIPPVATVHLQLDEVVFPSQQGQTYRVKITSSDKPRQTTIWMEHVQSREQRECTFADVRMLDGKMSHEIPEKAIFEALVRCLRSLKSYSTAAGSAGGIDESQRDKFPPEDPGKVDLVRPDAHSVCLQLMFPCYEFWQQKHRFMMKLVPAQARLQSLVRELDKAKRELAMAQTRLETVQTQNQRLEAERNQLRTLLNAYQEKEQAYQRFESLQQQLREAQEAKLAIPVAPAPTAQEPAKKSPAARKRDTRSFHARSGWLVSSNASTTLASSPDKSISWDAIVETTDKYFEIMDEASRVVRILQTGTYQLNLSVTHENSMGLSIWIRNYDVGVGAETTRKLEPTLVQFYNNKQRVSRLDQVVELSVGDHVSVHLLELNVQRNRHIWLDHFVPQSNMFFLTFLAHELVYKEERQTTITTPMAATMN